MSINTMAQRPSSSVQTHRNDPNLPSTNHTALTVNLPLLSLQALISDTEFPTLPELRYRVIDHGYDFPRLLTRSLRTLHNLYPREQDRGLNTRSNSGSKQERERKVIYLASAFMFPTIILTN